MLKILLPVAATMLTMAAAAQTTFDQANTTLSTVPRLSVAANKMHGGHPMAPEGRQDGHGQLVIGPAWARATPGRARNGAAYLTVTNRGDEADRLLSVSSPAASRVEIHRNIDENGIMRMRKVEGIDIPAGKSVSLAPGGYHVMMMGLAKPLVKGQTFSLKLTFDKLGERTVTVEVLGVGAIGGHEGHK